MTANRPSVTLIVFWCFLVLLGATFVAAAMQGNNGLFRRTEVMADTRALEVELSALKARMARMENLTRRMSDDYLDLDLLDEQARSVLGLLRADEIVVR